MPELKVSEYLHGAALSFDLGFQSEKGPKGVSFGVSGKKNPKIWI